MSSHNDAAPAYSTRRYAAMVLLVFCGAFFLRGAAAAWVEMRVQEQGRQFFIEGDANGYWHLAHRIAAGEDYTIHQPPRRILRVPGFPLLLAACIRAFGDNLWATRVTLALVGAGCCLVTWRLGRLLAGEQVGILAAVLMAIHPFQVGNSVLILSETWFTLWMMAGLLALGRLTTGDTRRPVLQAALTGGLIAAAVLIRPGFLLWLAPAVLAVLCMPRPIFKRRCLLAGTILIAFGLTMLPWAARNHAVSGHWVITSLWGGPSLYDGLNPQADGGSNMKFFDEENVLATMTEYEMNAHYQQRAMQFVRQNPGRTLQLAGLKAVRFLQPLPATLQSVWGVWVICIIGYLIFLLLCLSGFAWGHFGFSERLLLVGPFLLFLGLHMLFVGSLRYRLPVEYPLAVLAAAGARSWLSDNSAR